jgi:hypothetical protein
MSLNQASGKTQQDSIWMDTKEIPYFVRSGSMEQQLTKVGRRILQGWQKSTLVSYNAAVKKFGGFKKLIGKPSYTLPISPSDVYEFVVWAG